MRLTIVIVNYNVKYYLHQCLCAVKQALRGIDGEIVVVDNHSSDGSVDFIRTHHPSVRLVENRQNEGFSKANNRALRQCQSDYVLLLNPDTIVGEDTLQQCIDWMDSHVNEAGALGVKMLNANGSFAKESRRGVPTPWVSFCKMSGLCQLFPHSRFFGGYYMDYLHRDRPAEIKIVSGAFMMINRKALDKVGLLDEDFFMYGEDVDLSYRLLKGGYSNYYVPTSILHYKGESTQKHSAGRINVFHSAMLIFFRKHFGAYNLFGSLPVRLAIRLKAAATFVRAWLLRRSERQHDALYYMRQMTYSLFDPADRAEALRVLEPYGVELSDTGSDADYVLVNAERTPFADMLDLLEHQQRARRASIATLFPSLGIIITSSYIFCHENKHIL